MKMSPLKLLTIFRHLVAKLIAAKCRISYSAHLPIYFLLVIHHHLIVHNHLHRLLNHNQYHLTHILVSPHGSLH